MGLIDLGSVKGDTGATGETGIKGDTGSKGPGIASIESIAGGFRFCLTNGENWDIEITQYDGIVLSAQKPILSYKDSDKTDLYAQLMNGTCPAGISGVTISFKQGTTVLGTAATDNTGKATLSDGYTSTGAGEVSLTATDGTTTSTAYPIEDCKYYNPNEVSRTTTNGSTIYDDNLSQALGTDYEISFDLYSDNSSDSSEHRFFIMPKEQYSSSTTQPSYGIYIDVVRTKMHIGKRENATTSLFNNLNYGSGVYRNFKIIKSGTSLTFFIDDDEIGTSTISWIDNYSDYTLSMMRWSSSGTSKIKNVKFKPL